MTKITKKRKVIYYIGIGMTVLGFILFISVFFTVANFMSSPFEGMNSGKVPQFRNLILGMIFMIAGAIVMNVGARGAAGSGLVLDPEKTREDLKPFNEAKGGMINDVISNIDLVENISKAHGEKEVIKIRCRGCGSLNDEDAKFCKGCGKEI